MRATFFLIDEEPIDFLATLDPDRDHAQFRRGERAWILQTCLRLARAGCPAQLAATLPDDGLVLYHVKQRNELMRRWRPSCRAVLIGIRADNHRSPIADFEIVQNDCRAQPAHCFFIPHWPQPGILPRDPARGASIRTVAYHGFSNNLDPRFLDVPFQRQLADRGIDWVFDSTRFARQRTAGEHSLAWHDYRETDLVLAVRPRSRTLHANKPATKLYNAWLAQVPALLGVECAYRALRRGPLDYIEVTSPEQALRAIEELRDDPRRYLAMIDNGRTRAAEFSQRRILERWVELLYHTLPTLAAKPRVRRWQGRSLRLKKFVRRFLPFENR